MRRQRGLVGLMGLAALVGWGVAARPAAARVTTEQSASILVFPKVIADGTRDTVIQITNTSNNMRHAHCFYVNGAPTIPGLPVGPNNPPLWTEVDFDIWLTKQQPTHWVVSTGRLDNPFDETCRGAATNAALNCDPADSGTDHADCCDTGFDPGRVPPVVPDFTGELKCIEVDASGFPVPGNALKGEATIEDPITADVSKYNAIGLKGFDTNNMDGKLCLGGGVTADCPSGAEYEACPLTWLLDHPAIGAPDAVVDQQPFCIPRACTGTTTPCVDDTGCTGTSTCETRVCSTTSTNLTVVPCTENFELQSTPPVTLVFAITNEFEQTFSASTTIECWASLNLDEINDIFKATSLGGNILQTRMRSASGTPRGVLAVLEETHVQCPAQTAPAVSGCTGASTLVSRSAQNAHTSFTDQSGQDLITIPSEQIQVQ